MGLRQGLSARDSRHVRCRYFRFIFSKVSISKDGRERTLLRPQDSMLKVYRASHGRGNIRLTVGRGDDATCLLNGTMGRNVGRRDNVNISLDSTPLCNKGINDARVNNGSHLTKGAFLRFFNDMAPQIAGICRLPNKRNAYAFKQGEARAIRNVKRIRHATITISSCKGTSARIASGRVRIFMVRKDFKLRNAALNDVTPNSNSLIRNIPSNSTKRREQANSTYRVIRFIRRTKVNCREKTTKRRNNGFINCRAAWITNINARNIRRVIRRNVIRNVRATEGKFRRSPATSSNVRLGKGIVNLRHFRRRILTRFRLISSTKGLKGLLRQVPSIRCRAKDFVLVSDGFYQNKAKVCYRCFR